MFKVQSMVYTRPEKTHTKRHKKKKKHNNSFVCFWHFNLEDCRPRTNAETAPVNCQIHPIPCFCIHDFRFFAICGCFFVAALRFSQLFSTLNLLRCAICGFHEIWNHLLGTCLEVYGLLSFHFVYFLIRTFSEKWHGHGLRLPEIGR